MSGPAPEEGCRLVEPGDIDRLVSLVSQSIAELRAGRGGEVWARRHARQAPYRDRLERELADPDHCVVAGTLDGVILGYGIATIERVADGGLLGVVTDLYTEPGGRDLGLGESMMSSLLDWCRSRGCFGVDSLALPGDRHTKNFFESFGLVARAITVHRPL